MSNVLLTGGGGYIGSILTRQLLKTGHQVTVLDWFAFGDKGLELHRKNKNLTVVHEDVRLVTPARIKGHDVIFDLAALSNDPLGDLDPQITRQVNFEARARLGRIGKAVGVERYLLASSCSVYGLNGDVSATETSATDPRPHTRSAMFWRKMRYLRSPIIISASHLSAMQPLLVFQTGCGLTVLSIL